MGLNTTIMTSFERMVEQDPQRPALLMGEQVQTYGEFNARVNRLAHELRARSIGPDCVVAVIAERSIEMVIGIFAIIKAGGAYLPILPTTPIIRINELLQESGAKLVLTLSDTVEYVISALHLQDKSLYQRSTENPDCINQPTDLVYVIYTSGSTGKPKGVMIEHRSLMNRLLWMQKQYPIDASDTLLQKTPCIFDVSVWELFWWSMTGARLCLLKPGHEKFPLALNECIQRHRVTVLHFVPSMFGMFLHYVRAHNDATRLASLRQIFTSGESLTPVHVQLFKEIIADEYGTRLTNLYGPTEATIDVTFYDCPLQEPVERVPIGQPIDDIEILILNEHHEITAAMEIGELGIAGIGVARGYINDARLTEQKFVPHPFRPESKMYLSGDLARWLPDGNIEFLGRSDNQVKIRGMRIELEEIETVIVTFTHVQQCVVVAELESENVTFLTAYLVPESDYRLSDLKYYLRQRLPDYMIPTIFIPLQEIPLTTTGKVNRKGLTYWRKMQER